MMYQVTGDDFSEIITREFTKEIVHAGASGCLTDVFDCRSVSLRTADFDMLSFNASFQETLRVKEFQDTSHVSMHFQLTGRSNATISGIKHDKPMQAGQFNVMNCVDPVSTFLFPAQQQYAYLCVGLKSDFFSEVLDECGPAYLEFSGKGRRQQGFSLFNSGAKTTLSQLEVLKMLQNPPVADNLKAVYLRSKVKELIFLSLNTYSSAPGQDHYPITAQDMEKLQEVKSYLSVHYLSELSLEGISRSFLLNEFKLKKGFKAVFGHTVFGYIHQLRMEYAGRLLQEGGMSIGEVAALAGYTSDSSFIRAFKSYYGCSPGKIR